MPKYNSNALRRIAEDILARMVEDEKIPESLCEDFATSLVRQWITYDGNATLFIGTQQVYLVLAKTPNDQLRIVPEQCLPGWIDKLKTEWKIDPDDLPEIIEQLNRGQSAVVTNKEGTPLRLWVNPRVHASNPHYFPARA